ncbi:MAG TPA: GNAT family N-acetyltransferase [Kribbellaceae bacterium]|nr:GNAT family N-acetyltransferase [Kribbellaceae bacterium]
MSQPAPTERLAFRLVRPEAAKQLALGEPSGWTWIDGAPFEGTQVAAGMIAAAADADAWHPQWGMYVLVRTADDIAVGGIGWHGRPDGGIAEVGYDLSESARGHGYASEALRALCGWALEQAEVDVVVARTEEENVASQRVMERAGFARVDSAEELWRYELTSLAG